MKHAFLTATALLISLLHQPSTASSAPLSILEEHGCVTVFEQLATEFLSDEDQIRAYALFYNVGDLSTLNLQGLELIEVKDLVPGSFNLSRSITLGNDNYSVSLLTNGNLYCENEKILGITSISSH